MSDISKITIQDLDTTLRLIQDEHLTKLKESWYRDSQQSIGHDQFVAKASAWFRSTKLNKLQGFEKFPCVDVIMGCTHFIESNASKNKWDIQVLPKEYAYYSLMGKQPVEQGSLQTGKPLLVSMPNYFHGKRPEWEELLKECEKKEIDIHVDCAWLVTAKGFDLNFDHPNIKSFAMSMSKYDLAWNRIGLRWSRQRSMDSCTLLSAQRKYNELTTACGSFMMDNIPRDYGWDTYGELNKAICKKLGLQQTMFFHVVRDYNGKLYSIGNILGKISN